MSAVLKRKQAGAWCVLGVSYHNQVWFLGCLHFTGSE
jgi:hypothetical protein